MVGTRRCVHGGTAAARPQIVHDDARPWPVRDKNRIRARRLFRRLSGRSPVSAAPGSGQAPSPALHLVEREVQLQHVHARLTENAELTATRITVD